MRWADSGLRIWRGLVSPWSLIVVDHFGSVSVGFRVLGVESISW